MGCSGDGIAGLDQLVYSASVPDVWRQMPVPDAMPHCSKSGHSMRKNRGKFRREERGTTATRIHQNTRSFVCSYILHRTRHAHTRPRPVEGNIWGLLLLNECAPFVSVSSSLPLLPSVPTTPTTHCAISPHPPLTTHHSPFTIHHPPFAIHHSPFAIRYRTVILVRRSIHSYSSVPGRVSHHSHHSHSMARMKVLLESRLGPGSNSSMQLCYHMQMGE